MNSLAALLTRSLFVLNRVGLERVLGAPLSFDGGDIANWIQEKVDTANSLLAKASLLQDPASEWLLLVIEVLRINLIAVLWSNASP